MSHIHTKAVASILFSAKAGAEASTWRRTVLVAQPNSRRDRRSDEGRAKEADRRFREDRNFSPTKIWCQTSTQTRRQICRSKGGQKLEADKIEEDKTGEEVAIEEDQVVREQGEMMVAEEA